MQANPPSGSAFAGSGRWVRSAFQNLVEWLSVSPSPRVVSPGAEWRALDFYL